jgi:DNA transposition AAA+ family ATPase
MECGHTGRKRTSVRAPARQAGSFKSIVGQNMLSRVSTENALISSVPLDWSKHFSRRGYKRDCREQDYPRLEITSAGEAS